MAVMRTYEYELSDRTGKVVKGRIDAQNEEAVANRLRSMGMAPIAIHEISTSGLQTEISIPGFGDRVKLKDLAVMARQLATMISAGLSLLRALSILADQTDSKPLAKALGTVRSDVETGGALSESMTKHREVFPPLMIHMIRAGEIGGFLEESLTSVAENYESEVKLRAQIKSAMTYPVMVFAMAILAVVGMLLFIVPVFDKMFADLGGELPAPTQFLVFLSGVMKWLAPAMLVMGIGFSVWWRKHKNDDAIRSRVQPVTLRFPVFGPLFTKVAIARFTRNFGTMLGAGVPILQALDIVGETSGNWTIEVAVRDIQQGVRQGQPLSAPLAKHAVFPPMVVQMITTGEDSGSLEQMLTKIAIFYDEEVAATTEQLTSLIEPLMIAFLGVIIGGMIVALYMPIFSIFELVQ
ncbi:type II secretion system F family protein [Cellulomonas wangsupingiae]|uniref:Type II secretion system F family protein n=1 Tax=Cellulomonas wangsupingiae TaxID=2968085 RepID=A0ABY5K8Y9_9CELL|nr:type II secretion system F family protein [Cellulomonas wangsupingiae]MCC2333201.1 type II secretion system F family protein [Cellulomonas wangsupingiae]MCM0638054.1 type II secretion system F family protein [Cellulomonas wangsupingiae]UUI66912.1 type II secretion system F family protein [Cellulomonas wangsupingiae]